MLGSVSRTGRMWTPQPFRTRVSPRCGAHNRFDPFPFVQLFVLRATMARTFTSLTSTCGRFMARASHQRWRRSSPKSTCLESASRRRLVRARSGAAELGRTLELTEENVEVVLDEVRRAGRSAKRRAKSMEACVDAWKGC